MSPSSRLLQRETAEFLLLPRSLEEKSRQQVLGRQLPIFGSRPPVGQRGKVLIQHIARRINRFLTPGLAEKGCLQMRGAFGRAGHAAEGDADVFDRAIGIERQVESAAERGNILVAALGNLVDGVEAFRNGMKSFSTNSPLNRSCLP